MTDSDTPAPGRGRLFITFGSMYGREPHPSGLPWIHPDGYLTVDFAVPEAYPKDHQNAYERARLTAWQYLNGNYSFDYAERPSPEHYPLGELAVMVLP